MRDNKEYRIEDQIIQFLTGLNDQFSVVKTQVLLLDHLPSLNKVFSLVIQEESNNVLSPSLPYIEEGFAFVNALDARRPQGRGRGSFNKPSARYCSFCNRYNHTIEFFYLKHGFPNKPNSHPHAQSQTTAHSQANASSSEASDTSNVSGGINNVSGGIINVSGGIGLAQDKIDQLVSLLQQANLFSSVPNPPHGPTTNHISVSPHITSGYTASSSSPGIYSVNSSSLPSHSYWLLDSGANEHICSHLPHFTSLYPIKPVYVIVPNNTTVVIDQAGTIIFSPQFYLTNVLYSPTFKLNLMFVAKVC